MRQLRPCRCPRGADSPAPLAGKRALERRTDLAPRARWARALHADGRGQAMVEYALIVAGLMGGLTVMTFSFLPDFINAFQAYFNGFYILLNLPIP